MIYKKTLMEELPQNCVECLEMGCRLPEKAGWRNTGDILKPFTKKRHPDCPLVIEEELLKK